MWPLDGAADRPIMRTFPRRGPDNDSHGRRGAPSGFHLAAVSRRLFEGTQVLEFCLTLLLALHLVAVNIGSTGPLVCIWLHRRCYQHGDRVAGQVGRSLAIASIGLTALGFVLGVGLLGLLWQMGDRPYFDAMAQFPAARYWTLLGESAFFYACMIAYVLLWERFEHRRVWLGLLAVFASTDLLYHFPPMMAMTAVIPTRAELIGVAIDPAMYRRLLLDPEILARTLHIWLASLAVTGAAVMGYGLRAGRNNAWETDGARIAKWGARIALVPTLLQLPIGVWVFLELPPAASDALLGGELLASGLIVASLLSALGLIHHLAAVAMGDTTREAVHRALILMVLVVLLMTGVLRQGRIVSTIHGGAPMGGPLAGQVVSRGPPGEDRARRAAHHRVD